MATEVRVSAANLHQLAGLLQRHVPKVQRPTMRAQAGDAVDTPAELAVDIERLLLAVKGREFVAKDNVTKSDPADGDRDADGIQVSPQRRPGRRQGVNQSRHLAAEKRRRGRINDRLDRLRELVPHEERASTAELLDNTHDYIRALQARLAVLDPEASVTLEQLSASVLTKPGSKKEPAAATTSEPPDEQSMAAAAKGPLEPPSIFPAAAQQSTQALALLQLLGPLASTAFVPPHSQPLPVPSPSTAAQIAALGRFHGFVGDGFAGNGFAGDGLPLSPPAVAPAPSRGAVTETGVDWAALLQLSAPSQPAAAPLQQQQQLKHHFDAPPPEVGEHTADDKAGFRPFKRGSGSLSRGSGGSDGSADSVHYKRQRL